MSKIKYLFLGLFIAAAFGFISSGGGFLVDDIRSSTVVIDFDDYATGIGESFFCNIQDSLGNADTLSIEIITPPDSTVDPVTDYFYNIKISADSLIKIVLQENTTITSTDTITSYNVNRNNSTTSNLVITGEVGINPDSAGTVLADPLLFAPKDFYLVNNLTLKRDETYVLLVISGSDSNFVNVKNEWIEHQSDLRK